MNPEPEHLRLGIDVGGTFTHGVALSPRGGIARAVMVPTTHRHELGVAAGVLECLQRLLEGHAPQQVLAVNHSTTQATNALLEGDLSGVEVHVFHRRGEGFLLRRQLSFSHLVLSASSQIPVCVRLYREDGVPAPPEGEATPRLIAETMVESEGERERRVYEQWARVLAEREPDALPLLQKASDISRLLGVKARVKTGILNCAMLPRMLSTLAHTQDALRRLGLNLPLMVLKSDGGVVPAEVAFARPLHCLLSGPAAGAAAALHFAGVTFGVFLEVGGTSTDISFIHDGRIRFRPARVGGHRLQAETLDLRTIALGGGSLLGVDRAGRLVLGPRSAHLAGLGYLSFAPEDVVATGRLDRFPDHHGGVHYFLWEAGHHGPCGFTLTDLANMLELIPPEDAAHAPAAKLLPAFGALEAEAGLSRERLRGLVGRQIEALVKPLLAEYSRTFRVEQELIRIIGGGGGVHSVLPFLSARLGLNYEVVADYPHISAVGAALAASTVQVRLPSASGSPEDVRKARELAVGELLRAGAEPEQAHCEYSFDATAGILRLTATAERAFAERAEVLEEAELAQRALELTGAEQAQPVFASAGLVVYATVKGGRWKRRGHYVVVLDRRGKARLIRPDAAWELVEDGGALLPALSTLHRDRRQFRDAGEVPPQLWVVGATRIYDLSTLPDSESFAEVLGDELAAGGPRLIVICSPAA